LQRGDQVKGGEDAMYQYFEYLQLLSTGQSEEAREVMKVILDYNRDDCLSTKLLAEWMSKLSQE
jgi:predicted RecB family nuclease